MNSLVTFGEADMEMQLNILEKARAAVNDVEVEDDFSRDVWCLLGLPIDNLAIESAQRLLASRIHSNRKNVLSTINVNWVAGSVQQLAFRATILNSDICTLDGKPLLWLARALGLPMQSLVPGSSLTLHLQKACDPRSPFSIFLFGGDKGIAFQAHRKINSQSAGLQAVGHYYPGFGSLAELSTPEGLQLINSKTPNILLVALGAHKGQMWIENNRKKLNANIISHLGATINFLAGTEKRAPRLMQACGLEWVWRIFQKPALWRRYMVDGVAFSRLLFKNCIPYFIFLHKQKSVETKEGCYIIRDANDKEIKLSLVGSFTHQGRIYIASLFKDAVLKRKDIVLDFKEVNFVDNSFLGLLLIVLKHQFRSGNKLKITNLSQQIDQIFKYNLIDKSFEALYEKQENS